MDKPKKPMPTGKPWKKGQSGNPGGRPKTPQDLKIASSLTAVEFVGLCHKYLKMNGSEIKAAILNPATPMLELIVAGILNKAMSEGDPKRLEFILDRIIGEVKKKFEITGKDGSPFTMPTVTPTVYIAIPPNGSEADENNK